MLQNVICKWMIMSCPVSLRISLKNGWPTGKLDQKDYFWRTLF